VAKYNTNIYILYIKYLVLCCCYCRATISVYDFSTGLLASQMDKMDDMS
jgi:hypothetical protein